MTCSPHDLRDYLFDELTPAQQTEIRSHLKTCAPCQVELDALRSTHTILLSLRDEEIPQRIGFVSDKVFEPSPVRRWFAGFWTSAARLGFVSSAMLSAALLVHALHPPAQPVHNPAQPPITQAEIDRKIHDAATAAVTQAVADTEQRAQKRTTQLLTTLEKKYDSEQKSLRAEYQANLDYQVSKYKVAMVTASYGGGGQ